MQKNCQTCKKNFEIRQEDITFYEQVKTAPPLYCPDCRMARRLVFRNERTFYKRLCDLCKKDMISLYEDKSPFLVYCHECWWSDNWDPKSSAQDYDPNKTFFEQFGELQKKVPRIGLMVLNNVRSEYTNGAAENKDCYLIFAADFNEDCLYGRLLQRDKGCVDCAFLHESELCYECIDTRKSFKCMYGERLQECADVLFSFDMRNCQNCIFCSNGRNLTYCIENKQYTKQDFEKKKKEIFSSYSSIEKAKQTYEKLRGEALVKYAFATKCNNATGDYMYNCHDGVRIFDASNSKIAPISPMPKTRSIVRMSIIIISKESDATTLWALCRTRIALSVFSSFIATGWTTPIIPEIPPNVSAVQG